MIITKKINNKYVNCLFFTHILKCYDSSKKIKVYLPLSPNLHPNPGDTNLLKLVMNEFFGLAVA